jgi:hypothetical protein
MIFKGRKKKVCKIPWFFDFFPWVRGSRFGDFHSSSDATVRPVAQDVLRAAIN